MPRHVFLAFDADDGTLVDLFRGQAKNASSDLEFDDFSVKDAYKSANADYIKRQIRPRIDRCSTLICLVGLGTWSSEWVAWEIEYAGSRRKSLLGVRLHSDSRRDIPPKALEAWRAPIVNWDIDAIMRHIS